MYHLYLLSNKIIKLNYLVVTMYIILYYRVITLKLRNTVPYQFIIGLGVRVIVFNANFNNISVVSWQLVLLVEESGVPRQNHRPAASH